MTTSFHARGKSPEGAPPPMGRLPKRLERALRARRVVSLYSLKGWGLRYPEVCGVLGLAWSCSWWSYPPQKACPRSGTQERRALQ
jgi:hypothetical protein